VNIAMRVTLTGGSRNRIFFKKNSNHRRSTMHTETFNYTTIFAPVGFFFGGILLVLLLNKFIGKHSGQQKS